MASLPPPDLPDPFPARDVDPFPEERYHLRLFVTGMTTRSAEALATIKAVCEEHFQGRYELEVVDVYQRPELAGADEVVAAPTLVKLSPGPLRRLVGDLSEASRILVGLGLRQP